MDYCDQFIFVVIFCNLLKSLHISETFTCLKISIVKINFQMTSNYNFLIIVSLLHKLVLTVLNVY